MSIGSLAGYVNSNCLPDRFSTVVAFLMQLLKVTAQSWAVPQENANYSDCSLYVSSVMMPHMFSPQYQSSQRECQWRCIKVP
jgi:hypothetical protein